jgi:hypothetical protein
LGFVTGANLIADGGLTKIDRRAQGDLPPVENAVEELYCRAWKRENTNLIAAQGTT